MPYRALRHTLGEKVLYSVSDGQLNHVFSAKNLKYFGFNLFIGSWFVCSSEDIILLLLSMIGMEQRRGKQAHRFADSPFPTYFPLRLILC